MGNKNSYGAVGRGDTLSFRPEDLKVITDPKHPLYDPRVEREPDEALIVSIMRCGVLVPLIISRDGDDVYVTDGRQRRAAAIEANKRLKKEGGEPVVLPCVWKRGDEKKLYEIAVTTNELRTGDSPLERARKMQHLMDLNGGDEALVAVAFGLTTQTVRAHLSLLECAPAVQKAVEAGRVAATIATKLSKLSREEQVATLDKMIREGATKGKAAERAVKKRGDVDNDAPKPLSTKVRERVRETLTSVAYNEKDETVIVAAAMLDFVGGDMSALKRWPHLETLVVQALMPQKKEESAKKGKRKAEAEGGEQAAA